MVGFEIIEHTADVGILARGVDPEEVFEQTSLGLFEIQGLWEPGEGERVDIQLEARDIEALLVDWLNELIYIHESRDAVFTAISVDHIYEGRLWGWVRVRPRDAEAEGTAVKAATYHQIKIVDQGDVWTARVYLDV